MVLRLFRFLWGYKYEWEEYERLYYSDGVDILFICKKSGRMKIVEL